MCPGQASTRPYPGRVGLVETSNSLLGIVYLLLYFATIGLAVWALVHVARSGEAKFAAAEQNRGLWLGLTIGAVLGALVGGFLATVAFILSLVYLLGIRPKVDQYGGGGPYGGW